MLRTEERLEVPPANSQHESRLWDVGIIGGVMGGGFTAHAVAEAAHDVLLIDRGDEERSAAITRT
jgi:choline dehydrogenase-like flavoprotein